MTDPEELRERARRLWALGDYPPIAQRLLPAAETLVDAADVGPGQRVLDVAAGTGNVAMVARELGAEVIASDIAPSMIEQGRARTAGLGIDWVEADAQDLPFGNASFDAALSTFGVIFAHDPHRASAELARVVRADGVIGLTAWGMYGLQVSVLDAISELVGQDGGPLEQRPEAWGDEAIVRERLGPHVSDLRCERHALTWVFPSAEAWVTFMCESAPPVVALRQMLPPDKDPELRARLLDAVRAHGRDEAAGFVVEPEYLLVTARR